MNTKSTDASGGVHDNFQEVVLRGGAFDGQVMQIPSDQKSVICWSRTTPYRYHRFNDTNTLYSESLIAGGFGGRR